MKKLLLFGAIILLFSCRNSKQPSLDAHNLGILASYMYGTFTSSDQAAMDSAFYDITLHMYPIWESRKGNWLYVEQAVSSDQENPYRQRVYQLEQISDTTFISRVYTLPDEEAAIGKWQTTVFFDNLTADRLTERKGCEVYLTLQKDGTYRGATKENTCSSTLRGATYATSEVKISKDEIVSWDRGFDAEGNQVWGAETGGYIFKK